MQPCDACYNFTLSACLSEDSFIEIQPASGFTNNAWYWWYAEDKFQRIYIGQSQYTGGKLLIPVDEFPEGFFTAFSGSVTLTFKADPYSEEIELTFGATAYPCIMLDFANMNEEMLVVK